MKTKFIQQFLVVLAFISPIFSYCQPDNHTKILGSWVFTKLEFTKPMQDSEGVINSSKGIIITFEKDNQILMKQKVGDELKVVRTGTYLISKDGKSLFQNNAKAEITILTDEELAVKTYDEGFITHFKRIKG